MTPAGKALKESYQLEARSQWPWKPETARIHLSATVYYGTRRRADIENALKLAIDSLTGIVFVDDWQIDELHVHRAYDKARPRIEIEITPLP